MPRNPDIKFGWSYPKRKKHIEELIKKPTGITFPLKFQGRTQPFAIFTVEIDFPKYRLMNGRTQASQEMYSAKNKHLSNDFFMDVESEVAQAVQHDLLWEMVENTKLFDYFKKQNTSQDEPLILTDNGIVVNGNRRLCAMREFYYNDQKLYSKYSHVNIILLPFCSDKDIDELEAHLQIQPDIKEDYTWISKACMLRARQEKYHYSNSQLADLYGISKKNIENIFNQLALVDEYLQSRGKPKQYEVFYKAGEYAFQQLLKARQKIKRIDEKDFFTAVSFCLIDNSDAAKGRLYDRIPEVKENLKEIADHLINQIELSKPQKTPEYDYDLLGDKKNDPTNYEMLVSNISNPENKSVVIDTVIDVIESKKSQIKNEEKANAVLHQVIEANTHLQNAVNFINENSIRTGIEEQLQSIEKNIKEIRDWLSSNA